MPEVGEQSRLIGVAAGRGSVFDTRVRAVVDVGDGLSVVRFTQKEKRNVVMNWAFWARKPSPAEPFQLQSQTLERKIVELFWLFVWEKHDKAQLASMLLKFYREVGWKELLEIDQSFRNSSFYYYSYDLRTENPKALLSSGLSKEFENLFLCLCTFAPNGRFRERALLAVESIDDGTALPFILIRLNDWVVQVRSQAIRILNTKLVADRFPMFVHYYGLVEKARRSERAENAVICDRIDQLLRDHPAVDYQYLVTARVDTRTRNQLLLRFAIEDENRIEVFDQIYRTATEPFIKLQVLRKLLTRVDHATLEYYVSLLKVKSSLKCKILLFERVASFDFDTVKTVLHEALFSRSVSIRRIARELFQKHRAISFAELYSKSLSNDLLTEISITGLGEVGSAGEATLLLPYLESSNPNVRKLALQAIAKLSITVVENQLIRFLADDNVSVSNTARTILIKSDIQVDLDAIEETYLRSTEDYLRLNCLVVLTSGNKWDAVYYLLKYKGVSGVVSEFCERGLVDWNREYNRSFTAPSKEQILKVQSLADQFGKPPIARDVGMVFFAIKGFTREI